MVTPVISTDTTAKGHYSPPWADMSMIGVAGSSGSGKTSLAIEIVKSLSLPWVIILSMVRAYDSCHEDQTSDWFYRIPFTSL
jgi:uridine kinase